MRDEIYGYRDLHYSLWHRHLDDYLTMIDIDYCEYCHKCKRPLALVEAAIDVGQEYKPTYVTRRLANQAGIPAYLLLYQPIGIDGISGVRLQELTRPMDSNVVALTRFPFRHEDGFKVLSPKEMHMWLKAMHDYGCRCNG